MEKRIVIIGAGYSGILIAKKLAKRFKKRKVQGVSVTLIDRNPFHTMLTELHEVAANRVDEDSIRISLDKVFARRNVNVKLDTITSVDTANRIVTGEAGQYPYDILVLAAGSKPTYFGVEGAKEYAKKLWSYDDAIALREHIHETFRRAMRETDMEEKKRLLCFNVVGAGFTGVEVVGELAEYAPILCDKFGIDRKLVTINVIDVLDRACPNMSEKISRKVEKRLAKMSVKVMLKTKVCKIGPDAIEVEINGVCEPIRTDTVIWAAGIESSDITSNVSKALESANRGRIKTDPYLRSLTDPSVYVAGDNIFYVPEGEKAPVPQVVENCERCADTIAHNILAEVTGKGEKEAYKPKFHGIMVSIGGRYGVATVGFPNRMFNLPSFLAMLSKHFINVIYFAQVLGWNKIASYLKHEFFTIRNCRSFVGGHLSNRTPSFLLVPLRIWLGAVWLFEGVVKIAEGWLAEPKLTNFFNGAAAWFNNIINGVSGADVVTTATGAGTGTPSVVSGVTLFNIDFLGLFRAVFVSGKPLEQAALADYAFKLNIPLMDLFVNRVILPNNGIQIAMQIFIVVAEILIGLGLISGFLTAPASAFSLILQFMFVCTTGVYLGTFWMIFAAVAVLIGAGRTFGLDYYAMPYLKSKWQKTRAARKSYLYHD
jgi:NADH dehydrogenase